MDDEIKDTAVITGCDSGIGEALARLLADEGRHCIISYLDRNPFEGDDRVDAVRLDLTDGKSIDEFCARTSFIAGKGLRIGCLVNNAGIALAGPVEDTPIEIFRKVFEVNFFGLVRLTQKLMPVLIRDRGSIYITGSLAGRIAMPFLSPYASSKFAVEGFAESLRREMLPYGIKTVLIEPAGVATPIWNKSRNQDTSFIQKKYGKSIGEFMKKFVEPGNKSMPVGRAAKRIYSIMKKKRPAARYIIAKNMLATKLELMMPKKMTDRLLVRLFSMDYGKDKTG
ncbi:MAG: SDR family oxidoreductase [Spirochaetes bacterium]|jgi:NAD(P)-dependent dehydrogenase (short-subunit alcohol dehydrogenase family)|nr:SDR family oxidoreductase [Spirochaetota bacterium]